MNKKKVAAVALVSVLLFLFAGAAWGLPGGAAGKSLAAGRRTSQQNTQEGLPEKALAKLQKAESMHASLLLDMEVEVFGISLDASAGNDMTAFRSPYLLQSDINLDLGLLGETERQIYVREIQDGYELYANTADGWQYQKVPYESVRRFDGLHMMETYMEQILDWELQGSTTLSSGKAYLYHGMVDSEGLKEILLNTESLDVVQALLEETLLSPFASTLAQEEKVQSMMETATDLPISLWIDAATGYPVRCEMDITRMLNDAYKELVDTLSAKSIGLAAEKLLNAIEITRTQIVVTCEDYNEAETIMLPKAALKARSFGSAG